MSFHYLKNKRGEITSVRAVAAKIQGRQLRATFSLRRFGSLQKAVTAAERWIGHKCREVEHDRHAVITIPSSLRPEIIEALELLEPYSIRIIECVREWIAHKEVTSRDQWTFAQAAKHFIQSRKDKNARVEYLRSIEDTLGLVARTFGDRVLDEISTEELETFLRSRGRHGKPLAPVTWRNYRRDINMVFRFAIDREHAQLNPAGKISKPPDDPTKVNIFSTLVLKSLLTWAPDNVKGVIAIMAFSGIRPYEMLRLSPEDIKPERGFIEVKGKVRSRSRRLVSIPENLAKWLELYPVWVTFTNYWTLRRMLALAASKAGAHLAQDVLRHSFGSYHLALHRSAALTAHEMGNSEQMVYHNYREVVTHEEGRDYFNVLPSLPDF